MGAEPSPIPTKLLGEPRGPGIDRAEAASLDGEGEQRVGVCKAGLGAHRFTYSFHPSAFLTALPNRTPPCRLHRPLLGRLRR